MKNRLFVLSSAALALTLFLVVKFYVGPAPQPPNSPGASLGGASFVRPHSPSFGNSLGRVTVVEWFDPECESCRELHPVVKKIVAHYKDRVHFVLRYMPYHEGSMYAASVLEEARELGKFEEALDLLFEKQPEWGNHHAPRPELIPTYLGSLGIVKDKLDRDYVVKKHSEKIRIDEADGNSFGVRGTPTFFVNGQMLRELGDEPLRAAIDQALDVASK